MKKSIIVIFVVLFSFLGANMLFATSDPDTTPDPFTFTDRTNVALSTEYKSNAITVTGIDGSTSISITGGTYSKNGGAYTSASGLVLPGNTVKVRKVSASTFSTTKSATLTIGSVSDTFSVTTMAADTQPDPFTFTDRTNASLNTEYKSNAITVAGINTASPISITGGTYAINGGTYTSASGSVSLGNTVKVRKVSSSAYATTKSATLTIGGVSDTFSVTTHALHSAGSLDTEGFNAGGLYPGIIITNTDTCGASPSSAATAIATQADGKLVVVGSAWNCGHGQFVVARYKTDGSLDTDFGTDGVASTQIDNDSAAFAVAIQADQKIVVAGYSAHSGGVTKFAVARYNTDGSLDTVNFNHLGTMPGTVTSFISGGNNTDDEARAVAIQADGKIVVAGYAQAEFKRYYALARYKTNGDLDTTFGGVTGTISSSMGTGDAAIIALAIQPADQYIVAAGQATSSGNGEFFVVRLDATGSWDDAFNGGAVITTIGTGSSWPTSMALQGDGKIVVAGYSSNGSNYDFAVVRYNTNSTLDTTFNTTGKVTTSIGSGNDWANAVAIQSADQKIVTAGYVTTTGSNKDFALVRYNTNGSLDTSFGSSGKVTTQIGTATDNKANGLAIQSDGKIVAAGSSSTATGYNFTTVRYWP